MNNQSSFEFILPKLVISSVNPWKVLGWLSDMVSLLENVGLLENVSLLDIVYFGVRRNAPYSLNFCIQFQILHFNNIRRCYGLIIPFVDCKGLNLRLSHLSRIHKFC